MRLILTILFLWSFVSNATIYYVDNAGNDNNNGTSTGTAWQTIAKVNAGSFLPGDQILFKKGGTWNERLNPPSSGSAGNPITFGAYGTGAAPNITGFQSVTGWSTSGGNVWTATFSNSVRYQNTVYIDGEIRAKGRYPNLNPTVKENSWLRLDSSSADKTKIYGKLTGTPNYTGGEIVLRNNRWTLDHYPITAQTGGTLTIGADPLTGYPWFYPLSNGYGYFIMNHPAVLDQPHEWCYDTTSKVITIYSPSMPTGIKASSIDTLVHIKKKNYLKFDGLHIDGGNMIGYLVDSSNYVTITNGSLLDIGGNGIWAGKAPHFTFSDNTVSRVLNTAMQFEQPWYGWNDYDTIHNNNFTKIGHLHGMGFNRFATYNAITHTGHFSSITNNVIDSIGCGPMNALGDSTQIKYNLISRYGFIKDDVGGVHIWMGGAYKPKGMLIRKNILRDGMTSDGNIWPEPATSGIYLDNESNFVTADSNTVINMPFNGISLHLVSNVFVRDNLLVNSLRQMEQLYQNDIYFTNNVMYGSVTPMVVTKGFAMYARMDSNYYIHTGGDVANMVQEFGYFTLSQWRSYSGHDINSKMIPDGVISATDTLLKYNATMSTVTIPVQGTYKNAKGVTYINEVTLQPFESQLLFKAVTDLPGNVTPPPATFNKSFKRFKFKRIRLS